MYCFIENYGFDANKINIPDVLEDFKRIKIMIANGEVEAEWVDVDYIYDESAKQKVNEALKFFSNMKPSTSSGPSYVLRIGDLEMSHHYYYSDKYKFVVYEEQGEEQQLNFINSFSSKIKSDVNYQNI